MFYNKEFVANAAHKAFLEAHWKQLWANRNYFDAENQRLQANANSAGFGLAVNALGTDFWKAIDNQVVEMRNQEDGMEIVNDLLSVQTVLPIGKTLGVYNKVGEIAEDVTVSIDGQAPYSFDHVAYDTDGDPVPIIQAGFGVNWRHFQGLLSEGIDHALNSQAAKQSVYNKRLVELALTGAGNIAVDGRQSQGLKNHRNTRKIDLTTANINLTTASAADLIAFFQGAFATELISNRVSKLDKLWVSPEVWTNLSKVYVENGVTVGTVADYLLRFIRVESIEETYALSGNEFLGYVRRRDVVTPLVGMPTGVLPLPRPLPESNYNFRIMGAMGMQVKTDATGKGGVFYGANLT